MNPSDTQRFLTALYQTSSDGYLTLTAIHPTKQHATPSRHVSIRDPTAIHAALQDLWIANQQGWGAYFSVALRKAPLGRWKRGTQLDVLSLPAVYADLDGDLSQSFARIRQRGIEGLPPPSAMVGSGRGLHLYFLLQTPTQDVVTANQVLSGLAKNLGGDRLTVAQALRLPGSWNTKPSVNRPCRLLWLAEERRYTLADFTTYLNRPRSPPVSATYRMPSSYHGSLNPRLIDAVVDRLFTDYEGNLQPNGWIGALCPCGHSIDRPGKHFGFLPQKAVSRCFGRHGQILLKDLCHILGVHPSDYGGLYISPQKQKPNKKEPTQMAKKQSKELVVLLRIPDATAHDGTATLTLQRGDIGRITEFAYRGLTLKGNIAEAIGQALQELIRLEAAPPPAILAESVSNVPTQKTPEKSVSSLLTVQGAKPTENAPDEGQIPEDLPKRDKNDTKSPQNQGVSTGTDSTDTDTSEGIKISQKTRKIPPKLSVSVVSKPTDSSDDNQQISLF